MSRKKMTEQQKQRRITRILMIMSGHVGQDNKVGMGEFYEQVFEKTYAHRINDTRPLRKLIDELQNDGSPILSDGDGYWWAATPSELERYCVRRRGSALRILKKESNMRKISMPELVGQLLIDFKKQKRR